MELLLDISLLLAFWAVEVGHNDKSGEALLSSAQSPSPSPANNALCYSSFLFLEPFCLELCWDLAPLL